MMFLASGLDSREHQSVLSNVVQYWPDSETESSGSGSLLALPHIDFAAPQYTNSSIAFIFFYWF